MLGGFLKSRVQKRVEASKLAPRDVPCTGFEFVDGASLSADWFVEELQPGSAATAKSSSLCGSERSVGNSIDRGKGRSCLRS